MCGKIGIKSKAFTLWEVIVSLVILMIIVSLTGWILLKLNRSFFIKEQKKESKSSILLFSRALTYDMDRAQVVMVNENLISLFNTSGETWYEFYENYIIRDCALSIDTFDVELSIIEVTRNKLIPDWTEHILLEVKYNDTQIPLAFTKNYPVAFIVNNKIPGK